MGNSVTRAHTRRHRALRAALAVFHRRRTGMRLPEPDLDLLTSEVEHALAELGLEVSDIGGQQVDDDTVKQGVRP